MKKKNDIKADFPTLEEAHAEIERLREKNRELNRRAQTAECSAHTLNRRITEERDMFREFFYSTRYFDRMRDAHRQMKEIYEICVGTPKDRGYWAYHSVMDDENGDIIATVYQTQWADDGIEPIKENVVETVRETIEGLRNARTQKN